MATPVRHVPVLSEANGWGAGGYQGYYRETSLTRLALRDGLGHVRGLMSTSKTITDRYVYDAYGNDVAPGLHNTTEGNSPPFRWNGSYPDSFGTGGYRTLYLLTGQQTTNTATILHVGARHYSPSLHRWLQRDPIGLGAGEPNLYAYCTNNPLSFVDPSGLCQFILYINPGGAGMGSHLLVGLVDNRGNVLWFSFYPEDPSGKKGKKAEGRGYVSYGRYPTKGGRGVVLDITDEQHRKLQAAIVADMKARVGGGGKRYKLDEYNCVDWANEKLSGVFGPDRYRANNIMRTSAPKHFVEWLSTQDEMLTMIGEWRPGEALPVRPR